MRSKPTRKQWPWRYAKAGSRSRRAFSSTAGISRSSRRPRSSAAWATFSRAYEDPLPRLPRPPAPLRGVQPDRATPDDARGRGDPRRRRRCAGALQLRGGDRPRAPPGAGLEARASRDPEAGGVELMSKPFRYPRSMLRGVWINLLPEEIKLADEFGNQLHERAKSRQYRDTYQPSSALDQCYAMRCEFAVAVFLGVPWKPDIEAFSSKPDVGACDVRSRTWARMKRNPKNYLLVRPKDPSERPYVLVYGGDEPWYLLVGWIYGHQAKQEQWRHDRMGSQTRAVTAYWVPEEELRCPTEL